MESFLKVGATQQNEARDQTFQSLYFETRTYSISLENMTAAEEIEMRISSVFPLGFSNYRFQPADERGERRGRGGVKEYVN